MVILLWLFVVVASCVGYLFWIDNVSILTRPNELGDFISGVAALASLPSILLILLDTKHTQKQRVKQEKEANDLRQFQAFITVHQTLNTEFKSSLSALAFALEDHFTGRRKKSKFHDPEDVIGYIRGVHFSDKNLVATQKALLSDSRLSFVAREFVTQVKTFIELAQQAHSLDDDILATILGAHPCYNLYETIRATLATS